MDEATLESGDPCEEVSPCKSGTVPQPHALSVSVSNLLRLYQCLLPPSLLVLLPVPLESLSWGWGVFQGLGDRGRMPGFSLGVSLALGQREPC